MKYLELCTKKLVQINALYRNKNGASVLKKSLCKYVLLSRDNCASY